MLRRRPVSFSRAAKQERQVWGVDEAGGRGGGSAGEVGAARGLPTRVRLEVERYLTCSDARFGFVEVTCETCPERGW